MAEETSPPSPPVPSPQPGKRERGLLNKAQANELTKAEQIGKAAKKTAYATALAERDITAASVDLLLTDIRAARDKSADAVQSTTGKTSATNTEATAKKNLIIALQEVQAAAKQKYARSQPALLQDYFVGKKLDESRPLLEQYSQGIIEKLATDTLSGITAAKITNLTTLRTAYVDADSTQSGAQSAATTQRADLETMIASIKDRRMTIQFASDAEWPWSTKANAGIRKEFSLPTGRPFGG